MNFFAHIDSNNIVTNVIVAEQDFIDSGQVGDASSWIQTCIDGSFRGRYAGIGYTYDKVNDVFVSPKPYPSWTLDSDHAWQPPTARPSGDTRYFWNEDTQAWERDNTQDL